MSNSSRSGILRWPRSRKPCSPSPAADGRSVQCSGDFFQQFMVGIRLLKYSCIAQVLENLAVAVAGDQDDRHGRMSALNGFRELNAGHFRHREICENEIYLYAAC